MKKSIDEHMTPELVEIGRRHGEDPATRMGKIEELKNLILDKKLKDLKVPEEAFLINFLRCLDFDVKESLKCFQEYYKCMTEVPVLQNPRLALELERAYELPFHLGLPYSDKNGNMIYLCTLGNWDTDSIKADDMFHATFVTMHHSFMHPRAQFVGLVGVVDLKGFEFRHVKALTVDCMKRCISLFERALPVNCRGLHFINNNVWFQMAYSIFKHMMSPKLRNLLFWHGTNLESLQAAIGKDSLPETYGGTQPNPDSKAYFSELRKAALMP